jgi:hypothetical protein
VPPISAPPPPPKITNLADLKLYWNGIRDWINSKGKCGQELSGYMARLNAMVNSLDTPQAKVFLHDVTTDAAAAAIVITVGGRTTTLGQLLTTVNGYTHFRFSGDRHRTLERADIYFGQNFLDAPGEFQGVTFMHELLHALLRDNDTQLQADLHTGGLDVTPWINQGCPDPPKK